MINYFPKYFQDRAIAVYIILLLLVPLAFGHAMTWYWWIFGIIEVAGFFYFSHYLSRGWARLSERAFTKEVFWSALIIRVIFVIFSYFFYANTNGSFFEFGAADSYTYHIFATRGADMIAAGQFDFKHQWDAMGYFSRGIDISDMGYPIYLSFVYLIFRKSILIPRLIKAILSAATVITVYRIARRNFNEQTARMTAVFCLLMPNLIYYCGTGLKETEMLFLTVLFINKADLLLRQHKLIWKHILECVAICCVIYFFRAILSIVLGLALLFALLFSSDKVSSKLKRFSIAGLAILLIGTIFWNSISEELNLADYTNVQAQQEQNMQWRAERSGGNIYAKYAGAVVFAPMIFTLPFPTMVDIPNQEYQQMLNGGNYVKNITSFFTIIALLSLLLSGGWRERVLPIAFLCGYLIVLVFSNFAQAERFHIPILPFSLMFAAYGITTVFTRKHKKWFDLWLTIIFVIGIGWTWLKLRGRGM